MIAAIVSSDVPSHCCVVITLEAQILSPFSPPPGFISILPALSVPPPLHSPLPYSVLLSNAETREGGVLSPSQTGVSASLQIMTIDLCLNLQGLLELRAAQYCHLVLGSPTSAACWSTIATFRRRCFWMPVHRGLNIYHM